MEIATPAIHLHAPLFSTAYELPMGGDYVVPSDQVKELASACGVHEWSESLS